MKNSLSTTGLSLSQAQSISNLCYQRAIMIATDLSGINNAGKSLEIKGKTYTQTKAKALPDNVVNLIQEKALLHSTQAFLMENIKAKDALLQELQSRSFNIPEEIVQPAYPDYKHAKLLSLVGEPWGWNQLTVAEYNEYLEQEAYASHIGQFIHKDSILDTLRKQLPKMSTLEWIEVKEGEKTPLNVEIHHTPEQLLRVYEELAALHRTHEQRVNYFKAKVKNLVTEENARISRVNGELQAEVNAYNEQVDKEHQVAYNVYSNAVLKARQDFEADRQDQIKATAALRINVDPRFQDTVDMFLSQLK